MDFKVSKKNKNLNLENKRFNRWLVLCKDIEKSKITKQSYWISKCDCGREKSVAQKSLIENKSTSCGCLSIENHTKHGKSYSRVYRIYRGMISRCYNSNCENYVNYGGRGIKVCDRWLGENGFINFYKDMGDPPPKYKIDRIDNDKDYLKNNCRWETDKMQSRNKRNTAKITFNGETKCLKDWAVQLNISPPSLTKRIKKWGLELAIITPKLK